MLISPRDLVSRLSSLALLVFLLAGVGCGAVGPQCPAHGGPGWTKIESTHLLVHTDLDPEHANTIVSSLERAHAELRSVVGEPALDSRERIEVIVFRERADFHQVTGQNDNVGGFFSSQLDGDLSPQPVVVMYAGAIKRVRRTFLHELVHRFVRGSLRAPPIWLNEGLAQYYSALGVGEGGKAVIGVPPPSVAWYPRAKRFDMATSPADVPSVARLLEGDREAFYGPIDREPTSEERDRTIAYYDGAWALTHMFLNGPERYRSAFHAYLRALQSASPEVAIVSPLEGLSKEALESDFRNYLEEGKVALIVADASSVEVGKALQFSPLSSADVHVLWARLRGGHALDAALAELTEAALEDKTASEPPFVRATLLLKEGRLDEALTALDIADQERPDRPKHLLARLLIARQRPAVSCQEGGRAISLARQLGGVADSPFQLEQVARQHLLGGLAAEGLPFATRAVSADPRCSECYDTLSMLLAYQGDVDGALSASDRALALLPEEARSADLAAHRAFMAKLRTMNAMEAKVANVAPSAEGAAPEVEWTPACKAQAIAFARLQTTVWALQGSLQSAAPARQRAFADRLDRFAIEGGADADNTSTASDLFRAISKALRAHASAVAQGDEPSIKAASNDLDELLGSARKARQDPEACPKGEPPSESKLSQAAIYAVLQSGVGGYRCCYNDGLRRDPKLAGLVTVGLSIDVDGSVLWAAPTRRAPTSTAPDLPDPEVAACVATKMASLTFPASGAAMRQVIYPLALAPEGRK